MKKQNDEMPPPPVTVPEPVAFVDESIQAPAPSDGKQTIEHWQTVCGTPDWLWAGMKLGKGWPIGKEVTREEYDAAVKWAANVPCR